MQHRILTHTYAGVIIIQQLGQRICPFNGIVAIHQQTRLPFRDGYRQTTNARRYHRGARCLRLHGHQPKGLVVAGDRHDVGGAVNGDQFCGWTWGKEPNVLLNSQLTSHILVGFRGGMRT